MVTEEQSSLIEAPKKKRSNTRNKMKLTGLLIGDRVKDILGLEKPVIIPREPEKRIEKIDTSSIDNTLKKLEKLEKNQNNLNKQEKIDPLIRNEFSRKYSNFENNMKLQSDAENFKYNSSSLRLIKQLHDEQKMPLGQYSGQKIENLQQEISKSLSEEKDDLTKYANFISGRDVLLLYRFMLRNHETFLENPAFGNLLEAFQKRSKEIELYLKLN